MVNPPPRPRRQPLSLKAKALQMLAQREQSVAELRRKLMHHALAMQQSADVDVAVPQNQDDATPAAPAVAEHVESVIAWLIEHRHLSEERFIESRVHVRASRFGSLRIRQELAQHGLSLDAESALQLQDTEEERARAVRHRKFGEAPPADASARARQGRFLMQRGFSADVVRKVLR